MVPTASARYSSATPALPAIPATIPHAKSDLVGAAGNTISSNASGSSPAACDTTTTAMALARREARPPRKSAAP